MCLRLFHWDAASRALIKRFLIMATSWAIVFLRGRFGPKSTCPRLTNRGRTRGRCLIDCERQRRAHNSAMARMVCCEELRCS